MEKAYLDKINHYCLLTLCALALAFSFSFGKSVLVPFAFALFFYAGIAVLEQYVCARWNIPRWLFLLSFFFIFFLLTVLSNLLFTESIIDFIRGSEEYRQRLIKLVEKLSPLADKFQIQLDQKALKDAVKDLPIFSFAGNVTRRLFSFAGQASLVLVFLLFMLSGKNSAGRSELGKTIQRCMARYMVGKGAISVLTGVIVYVVLISFGVELALVISLLAILLNFIPSVGSIIATALPAPVLFLQMGFSLPAFLLLAVLGLIQFLIGNVLEPKLMGEGLGLHPITILVFLLFWGLVWGIPGLFLAVPITAVLRLIMERIQSLQPLARLMAGGELRLDNLR